MSYLGMGVRIFRDIRIVEKNVCVNGVSHNIMKLGRDQSIFRPLKC